MAETLFPHGGYHKGSAASTQPPNTSPDLNNVRPLGNLDDRYRGGQRPGQDKWSSTRVSGAADGPSPIVEMVSVTIVTII